MSSATSCLIDPDPRAVNQPNGNRDNLLSSRERRSLANRASTTCSHSVSAAPSSGAEPQQRHRREADLAQSRRLGAGHQQPGQLDQQHERRQLHQRDHRLQHTGGDQRRAQRREQPARGLRAPAALDRVGASCCTTTVSGSAVTGSFSSAISWSPAAPPLVAAAGAHRAPGAPVGLRVDLGFGEAEVVAQPGPDVLERGGFRCRPGIPVRPVAGSRSPPPAISRRAG